MVAIAAIVFPFLSAIFQAVNCISCRNLTENSVPKAGLKVENGTLTFFNMIGDNELLFPEFKYSLGRCLQASVQCGEKELNISIGCLHGRIAQLYTPKIYATLTYINYEFTTTKNGQQSFELFVCYSNLRQGWMTVNQEPKFVDPFTIGWSRLTFYEECACNFRIEFKIVYADPPFIPRDDKKISQSDWKEKSYWIPTGVVVIALSILVLCVVCSYL
ncbi:uncharacterized protein LOC128299109 [Anopheles moucheti]|uniref:uncharacterized protein LOC128299109 n=1 Tax=Anopheles moucheti TaxID=186751 RepID=UPI0022EFF1C8|nr:uncharacterized protein LOC128299109 [Anopheles moucheti]